MSSHIQINGRERTVRDTINGLEGKLYHEPLKIKKLNIISKEKPRMASVGDYWDNRMIQEIEALQRKNIGHFPQVLQS
jgi:hypothetical protein